MKRSALVGLALLAVSGLSGCAAGAPEAATPTVTVTQTITAAPTPAPQTPEPSTPQQSLVLDIFARVGQQPLANATVQVYQAGVRAPIAMGATDLDGQVTVAAFAADDAALYVTSRGGQVGQGQGVWAPVELATLVGVQRPSRVVLDERTTVAAAYAAAPYVSLDGQLLGDASAIDAAAVRANRLVDPVTGDLGPQGEPQAAMINTLAGAVTACSVREPMCQALTMPNTLGKGGEFAATTFAGLAAVARDPARGEGGIFAVQQGFTDFQPTLTEPPGQFVLTFEPS